MKTVGVVQWALCLALTFSIASCVDHEVPSDEHWRVKSLTRVLPDNPQIKHVSTFSYDQQGKLGSITTAQMPDSPDFPEETSSYQYDGDGRLKQMDRTLTTGGSEKYLYSYNPSGKLTGIQYTAAPDNFFNFALMYDAAYNLLSSRRTFNFSSVSYEQLHTYAFNLGNLITLITKTTVTRTIPSTSITTTDLTYDDHQNPFFGNYLIPAPVKPATPSTGNFNLYTYFGGVDNVLHLSKNNLTSAKSSGMSEAFYQYSYNAWGLPETRTTLFKATPSSPEVLQETLHYEYETY